MSTCATCVVQHFTKRSSDCTFVSVLEDLLSWSKEDFSEDFLEALVKEHHAKRLARERLQNGLPLLPADKGAILNESQRCQRETSTSISAMGEMERRDVASSPPLKRQRISEISERLHLLMPPPSPLPRRSTVVQSASSLSDSDRRPFQAMETEGEGFQPCLEVHLGALSIPDTPVVEDTLANVCQELFPEPSSFVAETQLATVGEEVFCEPQFHGDADTAGMPLCPSIDLMEVDRTELHDAAALASGLALGTHSATSDDMPELPREVHSKQAESLPLATVYEGGAQPLSLFSDMGSLSSGPSLTPALLPHDGQLDASRSSPPVALSGQEGSAMRACDVVLPGVVEEEQGGSGDEEGKLSPAPLAEQGIPTQSPDAQGYEFTLTADTPVVIPPCLALCPWNPSVASMPCEVSDKASEQHQRSLPNSEAGLESANGYAAPQPTAPEAGGAVAQPQTTPENEPDMIAMPVEGAVEVAPQLEETKRRLEGSVEFAIFSQDLLDDKATSQTQSTNVAEPPRPATPPAVSEFTSIAAPCEFYGVESGSAGHTGQPHLEHCGVPFGQTSHPCSHFEPQHSNQFLTKQVDSATMSVRPTTEFSLDGRRSTGRLLFGMVKDASRLPPASNPLSELSERPMAPSLHPATVGFVPSDDIQEFQDPPVPSAMEPPVGPHSTFAPAPVPRSMLVSSLAGNATLPIEPPKRNETSPISLYSTPAAPAASLLLSSAINGSCGNGPIRLPSPADTAPTEAPRTSPPEAPAPLATSIAGMHPPTHAECSSILGMNVAAASGPFPFLNRDHPVVLHGSAALPTGGSILHAAWASGSQDILGVCTQHSLLLLRFLDGHWQCWGRFMADVLHGEELYGFCFDVRSQVVCLCGRLKDARFVPGPNAKGLLVTGLLICNLNLSEVKDAGNALDCSIAASGVLPHEGPVHTLLCDRDNVVFTGGQDGLLVKTTMGAHWRSLKDCTLLQAVPSGPPQESTGRAPILSLALPDTHFATILLGICCTPIGNQLAIWNRSSHQLLTTLPCHGQRILRVIPEKPHRQHTPNDFSHLLVLLLEEEAGQQVCTLNTINADGIHKSHIYQCKQQELGPRLCMDVTFHQRTQSSKYLALGSSGGMVALHNLSTGNCVGILCDLAGTAVDAVAFHPQRSLFATCGRIGVVNVYCQPDGASP